MYKLALCCLVTFVASGLHAQTIISDGYSFDQSGAPLASMYSRTPDTADLPGRTYTVNTLTYSGSGSVAVGGPYTSITGRDYVGQTGFNTTTSLDISSAGGYTKPQLLTVSLDLRINSLQEDNSSSSRGIGLGFFTISPADGVDANTGFTGLNFTPTGTVVLEINGARQGNVAAAPAGFSANIFYNLSYRVDTTTGLLSNVLFNGQDVSASFAGVDTGLRGANTNRAGYYGSSANNQNAFGYVDSFLVTGAVPEPSTWALLGIGAVGAGVVALRRRRVLA